jgi:dipeptidyl aminopeptidase/acylaminoacyl peptidase
VLERGQATPRVTSVEMPDPEKIASAQATQHYEVAEIAWNADDSRLAVVTRQFGTQWWADTDSRLVVLKRNGRVEQDVRVATNGMAATPQWTGDGQGILVQTTPHGGRRIIYVDRATAGVWDLTGARWDPWFVLDPATDTLILSNGRGGFWRSRLVYAADGE